MEVHSCLAEDFPYDARFLIVGESHQPAVAPIDQLLMVQAEQMQKSGVIVEVVHNVFDCLMAEFVSLTMSVSSPETTAGQPHGKPVGVVIPADLVPPLIILDYRQATHLPAPVDNGCVEQAPALKIRDERCGWAVDFSAARG